MKPLIKSLMLYVLMLGLVATSIFTVSPIYIYLMYLIIISAVLYLSDGIFLGKQSSTGLLLGSALMGAIFIIEVIAGWVKVEGFVFYPGMLLSLFILQILVAVGEEISFRGYILQNLINGTGIRRGIFLTSLMFSSIHIPSIVYYRLDIIRGIIAFIVVGLLGAMLAIIYLEYGLISAIGFHFSWNFLQYNIFSLSDIQPGLMNLRNLEPNFLTGGNYGPEAGISGFFLVLFTLVIFIKKAQIT